MVLSLPFYDFHTPFVRPGSYCGTVTKPKTLQGHYDIAARRIAGTRDEKLEQIDEAIQELLHIKLLECASEDPGVHFFAVPRRRHWIAMTVTMLALFVILMLLGVRAAHAQAPAAAPAASDARYSASKR